jgi:glycerol-3-phosphate acyltransferase PlsY
MNILGILLGYLTGSVPTAVWWGRAFYAIDVREHGSGNAGATNTFRVLGKKAGIIVLVIDVLKGVLATCYPLLLFQFGLLPQDNLQLLQILSGSAAVLGHIFPIYAGFKGGKGVATLLGVAIGLAPLAALICVIIFLAVLLTTHYVSVGSMLAAFTFLLLLFTPYFQPESYAMYSFASIMVIGVVFTHRKNIERLRAGNENKTYLFKRT